MDKGLITQLKILKLSNLKPNFSELARLYDLDCRTVKRYYDRYEGKPKHHNKSSRLDEHYDLIKTKLSLRGANVSAVYEYIKDEVDSSIGTYLNFNKYVKSKGLKPKKTEEGHPRYETDMGVQAQVDCSINTQTFFTRSILNQLGNLSIVMYNVLYYNNLKNSLD